MRIFRRYELRSTEPTGESRHVSWHMFRSRAFARRMHWTNRLYENDGSRCGDTLFTVRKVED